MAPYPERTPFTVFYDPKDPGVQLHGAVELGQVVVVRLQQLGEQNTWLFTKQSCRGGRGASVEMDVPVSFGKKDALGQLNASPCFFPHVSHLTQPH